MHSIQSIGTTNPSFRFYWGALHLSEYELVNVSNVTINQPIPIQGETWRKFPLSLSSFYYLLNLYFRSWLWVIVIFLASKWTEIGIYLASACISRGRTVPRARTRGDRLWGWRLPVSRCALPRLSPASQPAAASSLTVKICGRKVTTHFSAQPCKSNVWTVFRNFSKQTQTL